MSICLNNTKHHKNSRIKAPREFGGHAKPQRAMFVLATVAYLTLLTTAEQNMRCSNSNGMTVELRQLVLDEHNKYRSKVARGLAANPVFGENAPKAARMFKMAYNCSIENKMAEWLRQCKWGHSPKTNREGLGENLWMMSPVSRNKTASIINAIASWFEELEKKGVPTANKFTMDVFNRGVGHYTQVVWQRSDRIGCGIQDCPNTPMTYVGCEYQTAGNMLNDYIYETNQAHLRFNPMAVRMRI
ncbi:C-type single domain activation associated secreted protein ASP3 [Trichostrongylus colubriformis]|uniref:C-type single domain activation associated secreted protein ASP3 n=1 Tax=Trichostrongylus colubriformis TaxID=6319 RepID=A0AAN8FE72_TRICO